MARNEDGRFEKGLRIRIYSSNDRPLETRGEETFMALTDAYRKLGQWAVKVRVTS